MKFYQLKAEGTNGFFGDKSGVCYSKRLFAFRSRAVAFESEFRTKCVTPYEGLDMAYLDAESPIKFRVIELEVGFWEAFRALVGI